MRPPLAIVPVYNEADILQWTLAHLRANGCDVHVLDNWSTDASWEIARNFGRRERYPAAGPDSSWDWTGMLKRIAAIARERQGWVLFHDADEIRTPPLEWLGALLDGALRWVEEQGFNAVRFKVFEFPPVNDDYRGDPAAHFRWYRVPRVDGRLPHVKAWLQRPGQLVDLHTQGGHEALFEGRKIFPENFVLKHYPFRSTAHAVRKLKARRERYAAAELARAWHVQYAGIERFELASTKELSLWPPQSAR